MVNRFTIGALMKLAKSIGANPNKFMGTKTNISFLGKGPTKNPLFQRPLPGLETASARSLGSRDALIEATEDAMGFATAGKLNSIQTQILGKNLSGIKNILEPPPLPMASITTLSRSGLKPRREWANLEQGSGIMSAKKTSDSFMGFTPKVVPKTNIPASKINRTGRMDFQMPITVIKPKGPIQILATIGLVIAILWTAKGLFQAGSTGYKEVKNKIERSDKKKSTTKKTIHRFTCEAVCS